MKKTARKDRNPRLNVSVETTRVEALMSDPVVTALNAVRNEAVEAAALARDAGGHDDDSAAGIVRIRLQGIAMVAANKLSSPPRVALGGLELARGRVLDLVDVMTGVDLGNAAGRMDAHLQAMMAHIEEAIPSRDLGGPSP